ncbi:hypothetical protein Tco_1012950 [Tanacetum coccineum]
MEMKDTVSSCSVSKEQEIQKLQEKARLSKGVCMKGLKALQSHFTSLSDDLKDFGRVATFKRTFFHDMDLLEKHLTKVILHEIDCKTALTKLRTMFSNIVQALKVDSVVMENTCFGKENSNSVTAFSKSAKESSLDSETKDVHAIKYKMSKAKERCMTCFRSLHSHLQVFSKEDLKGTRIEHRFKRAFMSLFGQDDETFTSTMFLNVDQLQKQLDKDEFQEEGSMAAFCMLNNQFQQFIDSRFSSDYDSQMTSKYFTQESKVDTGKALDVGLVVTESSGTESEVQDESSRSGNDTDADDADIRPIYDEEPMVEVQLTAECNIFTTGQQHTEQPEFNNEGGVDQYTEKCQVKSLMLDSSLDNKTTEFSNQSLESENICLKKTVAQFQKDFSRMEAHYIALELKYQNQSSKSRQHGQFSKVKSKEAKIKHDIDVIETINIELEHSVAKLLAENEHLHKENEHLKQTYKDVYDSIKKTRVQTKDHHDSLIVQLNNKSTENADLKAQIQEKILQLLL